MKEKYVCMIVQGCIIEEVYDKRLAGFCVWVCVKVPLYVGFYKDIDV